MKGTTRTLCGLVRRQTFCALTDRTTGRARRRPEEKRARLLAAARTIFGETGYGASVHEICQAAGVGIGTFYLQFPDKSDLMRFLMDEEHQYRVRAFDALAAEGADDLASEVARVLAGSDRALLRAMVEACGADERLRDFGREIRKESQERLAAGRGRAPQARRLPNPGPDPRAPARAKPFVGGRAGGGDM